MPVYRFHFSLGRMLILMAALGVWFAALGVLPAPWIIWLGTVVVYLVIAFCFSAHDESSGEAASPAKPPADGRDYGATFSRASENV